MTVQVKIEYTNTHTAKIQTNHSDLTCNIMATNCCRSQYNCDFTCKYAILFRLDKQYINGNLLRYDYGLLSKIIAM